MLLDISLCYNDLLTKNHLWFIFALLNRLVYIFSKGLHFAYEAIYLVQLAGSSTAAFAFTTRCSDPCLLQYPKLTFHVMRD